MSAFQFTTKYINVLSSTYILSQCSQKKNACTFFFLICSNHHQANLNRQHHRALKHRRAIPVVIVIAAVVLTPIIVGSAIAGYSIAYHFHGKDGRHDRLLNYFYFLVKKLKMVKKIKMVVKKLNFFTFFYKFFYELHLHFRY